MPEDLNFTLENLHEAIKNEYEQLKARLISNATAAKEALLAFDAAVIGSNDLDDTVAIYKIYENLLLFADEEVLRAFKTMGFKSSSLKWLTRLPDIEEEFAKIEQCGFFIHRPFVLFSLLFYLDTKVKNVVQLETGFYVHHDGRPWNTATKGIYEVFRRTEAAHSKGKEPKDALTKLMLEEIKKMDSQHDKPQPRKFYTDLFQGKTESNILLGMLDGIADLNNDRNETKILNASYGLFRLVCKDHNLPEEDEIIGTTKAKLLRKLLYKK